MHLPSIRAGNIDIILVLADKICTFINCSYSLQKRLTKMPPLITKFGIFAKNAEPEL